ncbi:MAG: hypothetical protein AB8H80_07235 [Planctomycetota bacterium]
MHYRRSRPILSLLSTAIVPFTLLAGSAVSVAQCPTDYGTAGHPYGPLARDGFAQSVAQWNPGGGLGPQLVFVAGYAFGAPDYGGLAAYDINVNSWSSAAGGLPTGLTNATLRAAVSRPNGNLIVGGSFPNFGVNPESVIEWDGTSWNFLAGLPPASLPAGGCNALAALPNGDVLAAGRLGFAVSSVARWDGAVWAPVPAAGAGLPQGVRTLVRIANGDIVAGGAFGGAGAPFQRIARFDGVSWQPLGVGPGQGITAPNNAEVFAFAELPNGDLLVGGLIAVAGGVAANNIARWDGANWFPLGAGTNGRVEGVVVLPNGDVAVSGDFTMAGGVAALGVALWNGSTWSALGSGLIDPRGLAGLPSGEVVAVGRNPTPGSSTLTCAWRFDGANWVPLLAGADAAVQAVTTMSDGSILAAGRFSNIGGISSGGVASWDGSAWSDVPAALGGILPNIASLVGTPTGNEAFAGGYFQSIDAVPASHIARFDGTQWVALGQGLNERVRDLAVTVGGNLFVAGIFTAAGGFAANRIARYGPNGWSTLGSGLNDIVNDVTVVGGGNIVVGGDFTTAGGASASRIALWNGSTWSALGAGLNAGLPYGNVYDIVELPDGDLVVAGYFQTPQANIARWDVSAQTWEPLAAGLDSTVHHLTVLPGGDVVASGSFSTSGGMPVGSVARWDGTSWSPAAGGAIPRIFASTRGSDDTVTFGTFNWSFGSLGTLRSTCSAGAVSFGAGCPSSGGSNTLEMLDRPWLGEAFRSRGSGLPANALVFANYSVAVLNPGVPVSTVFPEGQPGCNFLASPLETVQWIGGGNEVFSWLAIPNTASLTGAILYHQMIPVGLDTSGAITEVTATNALQLTIGRF